MAGFKINLKSLIIQRAAKTGEIVTQADIQRATGISQPALSNWNNGTAVTRLDFESVRKLMEYFDCDLCELVSMDLSDSEG
jgi:DNA-binding Xre family transcriptional regulator